MSRKKKKLMKINESFLDAYVRMDMICCEKFGIATGGATEYINRLINSRFAPGRDEVLPRLVKYRNIRNRIAHEENALFTIDELTKSDIKWLGAFGKTISKKKDPISVYLRRARRYARRRKLLRWGIFIFVLLLIAGAAALYFLYFK